ncbi:XRE family transcriptional regulator [Gramella lutea]|uniref:XRE family transcriptional regulator n=1 Tax=Christiangramia lutea TaxID=1607951 RepID=A0A9X1V744_9FLAO|nr:XRE family transcriptional regulator [Christiangramia lutea]MCH4824264.1 XRE family transcriptional regulator [Christiangramia lutea]
MTPFDKIKEARELLGLNQTSFAEKVGVSQKDVSNLEAGNKKFIPNKYIGFLLQNNFDLNSLFDPTKELCRKSMTQVKEPTKVYKLRTDTDIDTQLIPLYNIEASAGLVELFRNQGESEVIDTIKIPNLPKVDGALYVTGDSMYPLLKSGDIIAYKQISDFKNDIFWGEMYLVSIEVGGEEWVSVKYIQKSDMGPEYIRLVSQNQHHQPKDVKLDRVRALALVKASIRINAMR